MTESAKLATEAVDTRPAITHTFSVQGQQGYINVGMDKNGMPWEVFLTIQKEGSTIGGFADAWARLVSTSLQYGVPLSVVCRRMKDLHFEPSGVTTNAEIPFAASIVDYVSRWIEKTFLPK